MAMTRTYPEKPDTIYFFGTCLADLFYPEAGLAGMQLLQREGVRVVFPQEQTCCGQPAYNSGYRAEALAVARRQLAVFDRDWPVVVPSGSCAGMIRHHYPELFAGEPDLEEAQALAARTYELTEFLVHVLKVALQDQGDPVKVTVHTSCSALREMGLATETKDLLRQLRNVTVVELERERECCGFGGTFSVKHPEISAAMVADKVADICATGARQVIGGDCGCLMNITGALARRGETVGGEHIASFLWRRVNGAKQ